MSEQRSRESRAVERITGTFWCQGGNHATRGEYTMHRGRRVCPACRDKISRARRRG